MLEKVSYRQWGTFFVISSQFCDLTSRALFYAGSEAQVFIRLEAPSTGLCLFPPNKPVVRVSKVTCLLHLRGQTSKFT